MASPPNDPPDTERPRPGRGARPWRWITLPRVLTAFVGVVAALVVLATITSLLGPIQRPGPGSLDAASGADAATAPARPGPPMRP